jgi:hypothetical protein
MGGDDSASGGSRQQQNTCYLTATPSAAGRPPPSLRSVTSCLLEVYHKCVDNGGWARVLYDARGGLEKLTIIHKIPPAPTVAAPHEPCKPGCPATKGGRYVTEGGGSPPVSPATTFPHHQQLSPPRHHSRPCNCWHVTSAGPAAAYPVATAGPATAGYIIAAGTAAAKRC